MKHAVAMNTLLLRMTELRVDTVTLKKRQNEIRQMIEGEQEEGVPQKLQAQTALREARWSLLKREQDIREMIIGLDDSITALVACDQFLTTNMLAIMRELRLEKVTVAHVETVLADLLTRVQQPPAPETQL